MNTKHTLIKARHRLESRNSLGGLTTSFRAHVNHHHHHLLCDVVEKPALGAACRATVDMCDDGNADCVNTRCQCRANFTSQRTQHCCTYRYTL